MVPVWFPGSQLPSNDMKQRRKVKATKKDVHLRDDKLADVNEKNLGPKGKRKQKILTVGPSPEINKSSITKLNWINTFSKKDLLKSFMK